MEPAHKEEYKGFTIRIEYDEGVESPRTSQDNLTRIIAWEPGRIQCWGDKHDYKLYDFDSLAEVKQQLEAELQLIRIEPLFMYRHSGDVIATKPFNDRWDSGQIGFIIVEKKNLDSLGIVPADVDRVMQAEIDQMNDYLGGSCFGYRILDVDGDEVESCWGFIESSESVLQYAREVVDSLDSKLALTKHGQFVRFERPGEKPVFSQEYGPFPFVQLTYEELRVGPDGESFGRFAKIEGKLCWHIHPSSTVAAEDVLQEWTDVVITHK